MNINSDVVIVVISLAAIISPILVALINNFHHSRMRKIELKEDRRNQNLKYLYSIFENYLQSTSRCIAVPSSENIKLYGENYSIAFAFFPPKAHQMLKEINASIRQRDWDSANAQLESLSIWLSGLMKDLL